MLVHVQIHSTYEVDVPDSLDLQHLTSNQVKATGKLIAAHIVDVETEQQLRDDEDRLHARLEEHFPQPVIVV